jgi:CheY-like chemotaxis protein
MTNERPTEILLRAEIRSGPQTVVSYAREITPTSVFVVTDWRPPVATEVSLRISFPTLVDPVDVEARVSEHRPAQGLGQPAGLDLECVSRTARASLEGLLQRVGNGGSERSPKVATRRYRVLLVEDNEFIRDMFAYGIGKFFAQRSGHVRFDHAGDAASARRKLEDVLYDLVIVDYYLPTEDGAAFIARLRRDARFARAPIVAISVGGSDAREATMSAGADLFLDKPVVLRDLFRTLHVLSQRGALA